MQNFATSGDALGVAVSGSKVYVAADLCGLDVFDLDGSNRQNFATSSPTRGVAVSGSKVYVATLGGLGIYNLDGNGIPTGTMQNFATSGDALGVAVSGSKVYVAANGGLDVFNLDGSGRQNFAIGQANGVAVSESKVFVATHNVLGIYNLDGNGIPTGTMQNLATSGPAYGVAVSGSKIYVAAYYGLDIINVGSSGGQEFPTNGVAHGVAVSGSNVYVATIGGLDVFDLDGSNRQNFVTSNYARGVAVSESSESKVYVATLGGLDIFSFSSLTVAKSANPSTSQDFTFNSANLNGGADFSLKGDGSGSETFVIEGDDVRTCTIQEKTPPSGWVLAGITPTNSGGLVIKSYGRDGGSWHGDPFVPGQDNCVMLLLVAGSSSTLTFNNVKLATISGKAWEDSNANGIQDTNEPGLQDVTVNLLDSSDAPVTENGVPVTRQTDADGKYEFSVAAGNYKVKFEKTGYRFSPKDAGADDKDSDVDSSSGKSDVIDAAAGNTYTVDAGLHGSRTVSGTVFKDLDADGTKDAGEPGLPGWTIELSNSDGLQGATLSDASGAYSFDVLPGVNYQICEIVQSGWARSNPSGDCYVIPADANDLSGLDFGNWMPSVICGTVFDDLNGDGTQDAGEPGIEGRAVNLFDYSTGTAVPITVTDAAGFYYIEGLSQNGPISYILTETPPSGRALSGIGVSGASEVKYGSGMTFEHDTFQPGDTAAQFRLEANSFASANIAEASPASITVVKLAGPKDGQDFSFTVTNTNGYTQSFDLDDDSDGTLPNLQTLTGLLPGTYTVTETLPTGWSLTSVTCSGGSCADAADGKTVTLASGGSETVTFTNSRQGSITLTNTETGLSGQMQFETSGFPAGSALESPVTLCSDTQGTESKTAAGISPGQVYTIGEPSNPCWSLTGIAVTGADNSIVEGSADGSSGSYHTGIESGDRYARITLGAGDSPEVTFSNTNTAARITTQPSEQSSHIGEQATFEVVAEGRDLQYQWQKKDASGQFTDVADDPDHISGSTSSKLTISPVREDDAGEYRVVVTGTCGQATSGPVQLTADGSADLVITKTCHDLTTSRTGVHAYTITVTNNGPSIASTVNLADALPDGLANGMCSLDSAVQTPWSSPLNLGDMAPGSSHTIEIYADVASGLTAISPNTATVSSTTFDPAVSQNSATCTNSIVSGSLVISGTCFKDENSNGLKDALEPGISGWEIDLLKPDGSSISATTMSDGSYSFTDLTPGKYTVSEVLKPGWTQTCPMSPGTYAVTLSDQDSTDRDFGNILATGLLISGKKYSDLDKDGRADPGEELMGWTISLSGTAADGTEVSLPDVTTAADGSYTFSGLSAGTYTVKEESRSGWECIGEESKTVELTTSDATGIDFLNRNTIGLFISGRAFQDSNGNGEMDAGESGLSGWKINLDHPDGSGGSTITGVNGYYTFENLDPGKYKVSEDLKDGWVQTAPSGGKYAVDLKDAGSEDNNFGNRPFAEAFDLTMTVKPADASPGDLVTFTITITSKGSIIPDSIRATDILPAGLSFVSASLEPDSINRNSDGTTTIIWTGLSLQGVSTSSAYDANPGGIMRAVSLGSSPSITLTLVASVDPGASGQLKNTFTVSSSSKTDAISSVIASALVKVVPRKLPMVNLTKVADVESVQPGGTVNYTISYLNSAGIPLTGVVITESYPTGSTLISASPMPDGGTDNKWTIGTLDPGISGTIHVCIKMSSSINISFTDQGSVEGTGFFNSYRKLSSGKEPYILQNVVTLNSAEAGQVSTSSTVSVDEAGSANLVREDHGSGLYESEMTELLESANKTIKSNSSLKASFVPTSFSLPRSRYVSYDSKISSSTKVENKATGASMDEVYRHADSVQRDQVVEEDKNGTTLSTEARFEGVGHFGYLKKSSPGAHPKYSPIIESSEDYAGEFYAYESVDEYGSGVVSNRSVSGSGAVSSDKHIRDSQRTFEHGTGSYAAEEIVRTPENYISKDIEATSAPKDHAYASIPATSMKWKEGIWSKSRGQSFLSEEISSADYIDTEATASGLNDLKTMSNYSGVGRFRALLDDEVDMYEEYAGRYSVERKVHLTGVSKYDVPHITLTKNGTIIENTTTAKYLITVLNDGDRALGPVYVRDAFPAGAVYLNSSVRPSELEKTYVNWTFASLSIGQALIIDLRLNLTEGGKDLINRVYAAGGYDGNWTTAANFSAVEVNWLSCCPQEIGASKTARLDPSDPRVIWYRIGVRNLGNSSMAARVTDTLPDGLRLINSSEALELGANTLSWVIPDLKPGKTKLIYYRAEALRNGTFANSAHVDAYYLDGSGSAYADASALVEVGWDTGSGSNSEYEWQPPDWGLDMSESICIGDDSSSIPASSSCTSCSSDDIP